mmetsp:Transcript_47848/g.137250  ORF Transcript_47848/g.137250 Transcript_47848/m.137250 type:complete len:267 (-) Transcript_47848:372-1172(-)
MPPSPSPVFFSVFLLSPHSGRRRPGGRRGRRQGQSWPSPARTSGTVVPTDVGRTSAVDVATAATVGLLRLHPWRSTGPDFPLLLGWVLPVVTGCSAFAHALPAVAAADAAGTTASPPGARPGGGCGGTAIGGQGAVAMLVLLLLHTINGPIDVEGGQGGGPRLRPLRPRRLAPGVLLNGAASRHLRTASLLSFARPPSSGSPSLPHPSVRLRPMLTFRLKPRSGLIVVLRQPLGQLLPQAGQLIVSALGHEVQPGGDRALSDAFSM